MCGTSALYECTPLWRKRKEGPDWKDRNHLVGDLKQERESGKTENYNNLKKMAFNKLYENLALYNPEKGKNSGIQRLSAEIASLLSMEQDKQIGPITKDDRIVLFNSDTVDGELCAEVNKETIEKFATLKEKWIVEIEKIDQLQTEDAVEFVKGGLKNLVNEIRKKKTSYPGNKMIFNITCGYKGTIPLLTRIVMDMDATIVYHFEHSHEIIRIDNMRGNSFDIIATDTNSGNTEVVGFCLSERDDHE